jgi:heme exporter protein C
MGHALRFGLPAIGLLMLAVGAYLGLAWVPPEREMGDVARIMYVHVPAVWMMLVGNAVNFGASIAYLFRASWKLDSLAEASAEVSVFFGVVGVLLGSIWAKPTWGTYWSWDPRLTTVTVLLISYAVYLTVRRFVDDPERRARVSSVLGILFFVNAPLVWFSVKWFNSLHQVQSSSKTLDPRMTFSLQFNGIAFLVVFAWFTWRRYRLAMDARASEVAPPEPPPAGAGVPQRGLA